jgi:succinyl-CoA synthetase alpha subunit
MSNPIQRMINTVAAEVAGLGGRGSQESELFRRCATKMVAFMESLAEDEQAMAVVVMMRLGLDECDANDLIDALRDKGHCVAIVHGVHEVPPEEMS